MLYLNKLLNKNHYLVLIILLGLSLRSVGVNWSLPNRYHTVTYNGDEYTFLTCLEAMNPSKLNFNPVSEKHPNALIEGTFNLYTYAVIIKALSLSKWIVITKTKDYYFSNIGEWRKFFIVGRLLSVFYGVLSILAVYFLGKTLYGTNAGLLSAFLLAISPSHVVNSRYSIMNVPGLFWIILAFIFLYKIIENGDKRYYVYSGICIGIALATRLSAIPLILMIFLCHYLSKNRSSIKNLFIVLFLTLTVFIIGDPYSVLDFNSFKRGFMLAGYIVTSNKFAFFDNLYNLGNMLGNSFGIIILAFSAAGTIYAVYKHSKKDIMLLAWVLGLSLIFIKAGKAGATEGRMLPILPILIILASRIILVLSEKYGKYWNSLIIALTIFSILPFYVSNYSLILKNDVRDTASEWIVENIPKDSSIGLLSEPSCWSPGLINTKYRHPDLKGLPDYNFVSLADNNKRAWFGHENLGIVKPQYVIVSEKEIGGSDKELKFNKDLAKYGYKETIRVLSEYTLFGKYTFRYVPRMLYIPKYVVIYEKVGK